MNKGRKNCLIIKNLYNKFGDIAFENWVGLFTLTMNKYKIR